MNAIELQSTSDQSTIILLFDLGKNTLHTFNTLTHSWKRLSSPCTFRRNCAAALRNGRHLFAIGGSGGGECLASVEYLDVCSSLPLSWKLWPTEMTVARSSCTAVIHDTKLIVIGGYSVEKHISLATVECCDLNTGKWCPFPQMSASRWDCGAAIVNSTTPEGYHRKQLIVLGGYSTMRGELTGGEVFDFERGSWAPFPVSMIHARDGFTLLQLPASDASLLVVGGRNERGQLESIQICDQSIERWKSLPAIPCAESSPDHSGAAIHEEKLYVWTNQRFCVFDFATQLWTELPHGREGDRVPRIYVPFCAIVSHPHSETL
jgi:hypothetical protein